MIIIILAESRWISIYLRLKGMQQYPFLTMYLAFCRVLSRDTAPEWVTYKYCRSHSILRWLPSKFAEWIGDNMSAERRRVN